MHFIVILLLSFTKRIFHGKCWRAEFTPELSLVRFLIQKQRVRKYCTRHFTPQHHIHATILVHILRITTFPILHRAPTLDRPPPQESFICLSTSPAEVSRDLNQATKMAAEII